MGSQDKGGKTAGIRDIAEALGTSIGTVDRALHGRSGVSARTKAQVLRMAGQLRYKPASLPGRLSSTVPFESLLYSPREIAAFFDPLRQDIQAAADEAVGMRQSKMNARIAAVAAGLEIATPPK